MSTTNFRAMVDASTAQRTQPIHDARDERQHPDYVARQTAVTHITPGCDSDCTGVRPSGYPCRCNCHRQTEDYTSRLSTTEGAELADEIVAESHGGTCPSAYQSIRCALAIGHVGLHYSHLGVVSWRTP